MDKQNIAKSTIINLSSRIGLGVLGLLQVVLIAKTFGVSATTDAYMVAIWIPLFIWGMGDSVLVYSLVPYLVSIQVKEGARNAREKGGYVFSWFFIILIITAISLYISSPYLVSILVPGFSDEARNLTTELLQWLSPAIFLGGLTAFFSSLLFTIRKFIVPAIAALFPDIGAICFILFGVERWGIKAVVIGFICGVVVQLVILLLALLKFRILPRFRIVNIKEFMEVTKLMGPRFGGVGINRAIVGVDRFFASMLGAGSVSILAYSYRLTQLPVLMVVSAFGKTLMPTLSKEVAKGNMEDVRSLIPRAISFFLFGLAPLVLLLIFYRESIIRILYQRGAFTSEATSLAAEVLVYYSFAILFQSVGIIFSGMFYATGDTWTPFKITLFSLILNAILDYVFMRFLGIAGIALATFGVAVISMILLYRSLRARIGKIEISQTVHSLIKIAVATGIMGLTIWLLDGLSPQYLFYQNLVGQFIEIGIFSLCSWVVFLIVCRVLRLEEYFTLEVLLGRKFGLEK